MTTILLPFKSSAKSFAPINILESLARAKGDESVVYDTRVAVKHQERQVLQPTSHSPELSVIVPAYREGEHIYNNMQRLLAELQATGRDYEVILVSDGNTDDTVTEAVRVGSPRLRVLSYETNMGKGYALTYGIQHCRGELVTLIDADMELDPRAIEDFIGLMEQGDYDVVVGSKRHPKSNVRYPAFRRIQSWAYQMLIRILFNLDVRDTQTGLKLFRRHVLVDVLPRLAVKRFAFDLELLVVAHHLGYRKIAEAPITLDYQFSSTIGPQAVFDALWDTAAIFYRRYLLRYYDDRAAH
ncbi:MAG TPA: glycosyltransferase family 2 protein [Candidatus Dormibacteraeota bacterium]|nr:glycosyltransferase family 2 protein [Candidatus Dormibacteraeota bacterium]